MEFVLIGDKRAWTEKQPDLAALLHGDLRVPKKADDTADHILSVFQFESDAEELLAAAAVTLSKVGISKRFGIRLAEEHFIQCGLQYQHIRDHPGTGVVSVDERHFNVTGKVHQFRELVEKLLVSLWRGDNRVRVFPEYQLCLEVGSLYFLGDDQISEESRGYCRQIYDECDYASLSAELRTPAISVDCSGQHIRTEKSHN